MVSFLRCHPTTPTSFRIDLVENVFVDVRWCDFVLGEHSASESEMKHWHHSGSLLLKLLANFQVQEPLEAWLLNAAADNHEGRVRVCRLWEARTNRALKTAIVSLMDKGAFPNGVFPKFSNCMKRSTSALIEV
eukprot:6483678-Amphidinium_carterae.1